MITNQHPTHWHQQQPYNRSFTSSHLTNVSIPLRKAYLRVPHQGRYEDQVNSYRQTRNSPSVTMLRNSVRKLYTLEYSLTPGCLRVCMCMCLCLCLWLRVCAFVCFNGCLVCQGVVQVRQRLRRMSCNGQQWLNVSVSVLSYSL